MPFKEHKEIEYEFQVIIAVAQKVKRPTLPAKCPGLFADLIKQCWKENPVDRPNCVQLLSMLQNIQLEYEKNTKKWDSLVKNH